MKSVELFIPIVKYIRHNVKYTIQSGESSYRTAREYRQSKTNNIVCHSQGTRVTDRAGEIFPRVPKYRLLPENLVFRGRWKGVNSKGGEVVRCKMLVR